MQKIDLLGWTVTALAGMLLFALAIGNLATHKGLIKNVELNSNRTVFNESMITINANRLNAMQATIDSLRASCISRTEFQLETIRLLNACN